MLFVVCGFLFVVGCCCLSLVFVCSLLLFVACFWGRRSMLCVVRCMSFVVVRRLILIVPCAMLVVCCWLLSVASCLPSVVFVICGLFDDC